eukprot:gene7893-8533_t
MRQWGIFIFLIGLVNLLRGDEIPVTILSDPSKYKREKRFQRQRSSGSQHIILPSAPKSTVSQNVLHDADNQAPLIIKDNHYMNPSPKEKHFPVESPPQLPIKSPSDPFNAIIQSTSNVQPFVDPKLQNAREKLVSKLQRLRAKKSNGSSLSANQHPFSQEGYHSTFNNSLSKGHISVVNREYSGQQSTVAQNLRKRKELTPKSETNPLPVNHLTESPNKIFAEATVLISQSEEINLPQRQKPRKRESRTRHGQSRIIPPVESKPNVTVCYEWVPNNQSFLSRQITTPYPIFDREKGLQLGEDGGKHVKDNATIFSPFQKEYRNQWSFPASEGQDHLVLEILNYKRRGMFVDVGARYWHKGSNSFALEYYFGWEGICIEADSHFYPGLVLNRTCKVVCNNAISNVDGQKVHFHYQINGFTKNPGNDEGEKYTVTVGRVFNDFQLPSRIDYLSIDIEGYEYEGIQTIDFEEHVISVISVERPSQAFHDHLVKYGYWWLTHLPGNFGENMYIHNSIPSFKKMMDKYRPNAKASWRRESANYLLSPPWNLSM